MAPLLFSLRLLSRQRRCFFSRGVLSHFSSSISLAAECTLRYRETECSLPGCKLQRERRDSGDEEEGKSAIAERATMIDGIRLLLFLASGRAVKRLPCSINGSFARHGP